MQIPCVYIPGPAPAVSVANKYFYMTAMVVRLMYFAFLEIFKTSFKTVFDKILILMISPQDAENHFVTILTAF